MHILIGLGVAVALLYFWLIGHWFARALMFLLLGVAFGVGGAALGNGAVAGSPVPQLALGLTGIVAAWFVAGIPIYYWRWQLRQLIEAEERQAQAAMARDRQPPVAPPVPALPAPALAVGPSCPTGVAAQPSPAPVPERKPWNWGAIFTVTWMAFVVAGICVLFQYLLASH